MKLVKPKAERLYQEEGLDGLYKHIDLVAGICYNRTQNTKDPKKFVERLIEKDELRPLEFGTLYFKIFIGDRNVGGQEEFEWAMQCQPDDEQIPQIQKWQNVINSRYSRVKTFDIDSTIIYLTTNLRVFIESGLSLNDLKQRKDGLVAEYSFGKRKNKISFSVFWSDYISAPVFFRERATVKWTCSRAIADEFRTHITLSSVMKSTRYVKENDMAICEPSWYDDNDTLINPYCKCMENIESAYNELLASGLKPQEARGVLPLDLAVNLIQCGYCNEENTGWERFFKMRTAETAHPDARKLAFQWQNILKKNNLL